MVKHEIVKADSAFVVIAMSDEKDHLFHCHPEYELYYFMQGDVEYRIEGQRYLLTPESLLLIPANSLHGVTIKTTRLHRRVSVHFLPEMLDDAERDLLLSVYKSSKRLYPDMAGSRIEMLLQAILECKNMESPLKQVALKHDIIALLVQVLQTNIQKKAFAAPQDERIQAVLSYLNGNLQKKITLEQLARKFHVSKNHLNAVFRHEIGIPINNYIRIKRVVLARQKMLRGVSAEEAAYSTGFNDYSNFYRAYKSVFHVKPSARLTSSEDGEATVPWLICP
jgi:AraC-like DNA-binding protein/quercetin dioxygenase-like cupin family protein